MNRNSKFRLYYLLSDSVSILMGTLLFNIFRFHWEMVEETWGSLESYLFNTKSYAVYLSLWLFWLFIFSLSGYYNKPINKSRIDELLVTIGSVIVGSSIEFLFLVVNDVVFDPKVYLPLYGILVGSTLLWVYLCRLCITLIAIKQRSKREFWPRVLLIGTPKEVDALYALREKMRFIPIKRLYIKEDALLTEEQQVNLLSNAIRNTFEQQHPTEIFIATTPEKNTYMGHLLYHLYPYRCPIKISAEGMMPLPSVSSTLLDGIPLFDVTETKMSEMEKNIKWCLDRLFALLLLILTSPLLLLLAVMVRKSSPGAIFFSQERIGRRGKPFKIYKFRTMYLGSEKNGPQLSHEGDQRITPIGRILRKYRLDELPQFYNVLRADMSFVGPRPERQYYIDKLVNRAPYYYLLHNVLPGITSWGMVRYGYASNLEEMTERLKYDWIYYGNMSLKLDITVLLHTLIVLFKGAGK